MKTKKKNNILKSAYLPALLFGLVGAFISRIHGGGFAFAKDWSKTIKNILWVSPLCTLGLYFHSMDGLDYKDIPPLCLGFALLLAAKATGHGQWFSIGTLIKPVKAEKLDFILLPFFGPDPRTRSSLQAEVETYTTLYGTRRLFWRCLAGLGAKGWAIGIGIGVLFTARDAFFPPIIVAPMGLAILFPFGYLVGFYLRDRVADWTKIGEYIGGGFAPYALAFAFSQLL